jgi:peptidoglycan/LPS O-acetylase OafA/YrhL
VLGPLFAGTELAITDESFAANLVRYLPLFGLPSFAAGIVLARLHGTLPAALRRPRMALALALSVIAWGLCSGLVPYMMLHNGALLPAFALVLLACAQGQAPRWLEHPWLITLGEASYALYITHLLCWVYVKVLLERHGIDVRAGWVFPLYAVIAVMLSVAVQRFIEGPARHFLLRPRARS